MSEARRAGRDSGPSVDDEGGDRETDGTGQGRETISDEKLFEALSNRRRRYALHYLMVSDGPIDMGDLSTQVAAWEHGVDPEEFSYDERKTVHTSLYQYHAPKLDEIGMVDYDSGRGRIELTTAGREVDIYLEAVRSREVPWATYFLSLSVAAAGLVGGAWADLPPVGGLSDIACAGVVTAAFVVSSLVFAYDSRTAMRLGADGSPPEVTEE